MAVLVITGVIIFILVIIIAIIVTLLMKISNYAYKLSVLTDIMFEFIDQLKHNTQDTLLNNMKNALKVCMNNKIISIEHMRAFLTMYYGDKQMIDMFDDDTVTTYYAMFALNMEKEMQIRK